MVFSDISMQIELVQGRESVPGIPDAVIVIDVIRAFTVAHLAFLQDIEKIHLVAEPGEAHALREENPGLLLMGEVNGYAISGFDYDNSPAKIAGADLVGRTLVQRTSNGVQAVLNNLGPTWLMVTGLIGAHAVAKLVRRLVDTGEVETVRLIASHPDSDEDVACGEYIIDQIHGTNKITLNHVRERIRRSTSAQKFYDRRQPQFEIEQLDHCLRSEDHGFVMSVSIDQNRPTLKKQSI